MPFYRYECESCSHEFRVLQPGPSEDSVSCPKCKSRKVRRMLPRVAVQFKGSGYYKTDRAKSRSKAGTKGATSDDTSSRNAGEASSGSSADSKPSSSPAPAGGD